MERSQNSLLLESGLECFQRATFKVIRSTRKIDLHVNAHIICKVGKYMCCMHMSIITEVSLVSRY